MEATHYEILEVSERATLDVIDAAWKVLARRYHPDAPEGDENRMRRINHAHDVLENPETRRKYDLTLAQERAAEQRTMAEQQAAYFQARMPNGQPNAYPPNILEMAAQRFSAQVLDTLAGSDPALQFLISQMMRRGHRA